MGDDAPAVGGDHEVDLLVVSAVQRRVLPKESYCIQYTRNFPVSWHGCRRACRVFCIETQAAVRAGQLAQREDIPMLLEEPPHFRLFPAPTGAEFFQGERRAAAAKLDRGRHM